MAKPGRSAAANGRRSLLLFATVLWGGAPSPSPARPAWIACQSKPASRVSPEQAAKAKEAIRAGLEAAARGDLPGAIASFESSLALDPSNPGTYFELASAQRRAKKLNAAEKTAQQGRKVEPRHPGLCVVLGAVYEDRGLTDRAIAEYQEGLRWQADSGDLRLSLGIALLKKGDKKGAIEQWTLGARSAPDLPPLHYQLAKAGSGSEERFPVFLHAEEFLNLEPEGARAEEVRLLLFKTLRDAVSKSGKDSVNVTFTTEVTITEEDLRGFERGEVGRVPVALAFELAYGLPRIQEFDAAGGRYSPASEVAARRAFLESWFKDRKLQAAYDVPLFDRWHEIEKSGHLEAYVRSLLRAGGAEEWESWKKAHAEALAGYLDWAKEHPYRPGKAPPPKEGQPPR